ncbi:hypothetical protein LCM4579_01230 [Ensifer sp. LCM 4579]|nr:hypothetical protein LCM4579_01230 [Ensifer sp. LCM 4579]
MKKAGAMVRDGDDPLIICQHQIGALIALKFSAKLGGVGGGKMYSVQIECDACCVPWSPLFVTIPVYGLDYFERDAALCASGRGMQGQVHCSLP